MLDPRMGSWLVTRRSWDWSGILALAAKRFGAGHVFGIDIDPRAISIAKANARLNNIDNADFQLADVQVEAGNQVGPYCCESIQGAVD
jgi:tRNA/tmRNA/rRNA uracil-C5-methylase (TrmA/RlmC/RlmD family)